jgi:DNA-binding MarR family transcriptional regulator
MTCSLKSAVDYETAERRLATGLIRLAVAVHDTTDARSTVAERTMSQQQVLLLLARRQREYPLAELAAELGMPLPAALSAISTLAREGMVSMGPEPSYSPDRVRVQLTERGRRHTPETLTWAESLLGELDGLDEGVQSRLLGIVTEEIVTLQREGRIPIAKMCLSCRFFDGYAHPGTSQPHHCWLVDAPFGNQELRLRCPDQIPSAQSVIPPTVWPYSDDGSPDDGSPDGAGG